MSERFAVYYAPNPEGALWHLGSAWLGRDAYRDRELPRPEFPSLALLDLEALTAAPRGYGFHATLRAPFEPVAGVGEAELSAALNALADRLVPFEEHLEVASLGRFIALRPTGAGAALRTLHEAALEALEPFRAPLGDADLARRRRAGLTDAQEGYLQAWGYPYVREYFRFHMTLTGPLASALRPAPILAVLRAYFSAALAAPVAFDGLGLYHQAHREASFRLVRWAPLRGV
jgi:hypothetical protein